jgi:MtN3 and saliva related transmembrane protein
LKDARQEELAMDGWWLTPLGFVAGICTTVSFVPQLLKAWRSTDTEAISMRTYLISTGAFTLWIVHGVMIGRVPIIFFNALSLLLSGAILTLKLQAQNAAARG